LGWYELAIDDCRLFYHPEIANSVTLADQTSVRLLRIADGRTANEVLALDGRSAQTVAAEINYFVAKGLLDRPTRPALDSPTEAVTAPKRAISVWLHVSNACNLDCVYCYIAKSKSRMSMEQAVSAVDSVLDSARKADADVLIKFAGGEPTVSLDLVRGVVRHARHRAAGVRVRLGMITNGTLITSDVARYLSEEGFGVAVSLDGPPEVNDMLRPTRGGRGSFSKAMEGIHRLQANGVNPTVMTTVTDANFRSLPTFAEEMIERGLRFRLSLERDGVNTTPRLTEQQDELCETLDHCYDRMESLRPSRPLDQWHKFCDVSFEKPRTSVCGAGRNYLAIGHDGSLAECGLALARPIMRSTPGLDLVESVRTRSRIERGRNVQARTGCDKCEWRSSCAGGCPFMAMNEHGAVARRSPYCQTYKRVLPRLLRLEGLYLRDCLNSTRGGADAHHRHGVGAAIG
jgi:uncharacterized protein